MGIQVLRKNSKPVTAVHQTNTWDGTGVDIPATTYEIHTYRWYRKSSDFDNDLYPNLYGTPINIELTEATGVDRYGNDWTPQPVEPGYYTDGRMKDGATVYFGKLYKQADEYVLIGEVGNNRRVGHIRKIKGGWKFRNGHDCNQYRNRNSAEACTYNDPNSTGIDQCGMFGDFWKD